MAFLRIRCWYVASVLAVFLQSSAMAQGTDREREACTPDVFRLCGAYIPDADRITACLRNSGVRLSRPCYDVFFPRQAAPRHYVDPRRPTQQPYPAPAEEDE
jgi:hypothetical protein